MDGSISYFNVLFVRCGMIGWVLWGLSVLTLGLIIKCLITIRPGLLSPATFYGKARSLLAGRQYHEAMELAGRDGGLAGVHSSVGLAGIVTRLRGDGAGHGGRLRDATASSSAARSSG